MRDARCQFRAGARERLGREPRGPIVDVDAPLAWRLMLQWLAGELPEAPEARRLGPVRWHWCPEASPALAERPTGLHDAPAQCAIPRERVRKGAARSAWLAFNEAGLRIGEGHPGAKLTDAEVDRLAELHTAGASYAELAALFCVSKSCVAGIVTGRRRAEVIAVLKRAPSKAEVGR